MAKSQPKIDDIKGLTQWINFLWLKLKDLFSSGSLTTNDDYLPKIDDGSKKLVKSNIQDDGTTPKYGTNTIWHSGNDGSDSGLDADLLDSKHASEFATSAQGDKADTAIQGIKVNDTELTPDSDKIVNIQVPTTVAELSDSSSFAQLENGKILEGNLPDYIFGQVLFGGFIAINTSTNKLVCTLSAKFKSKYNITENTLLLENMPASTYEGVFFMATNSWNTQPYDAQVGDWLISNGFTWSKVDNSDAVSSVNGQIGAVVLTPADVGAASNNHTHNYGSLNNLPEIISMEEQIASETSLDNVYSTGIHLLKDGYKYYSVPSKVCGTIEVREDLEGFLIVYSKNGILAQQLHDTKNNILFIRSFNSETEVWNFWKRILTCKDEIPDDLEGSIEEEGLYQINSSYQRISLNSEDIKGKTVEIDLKLFNSQVGAKLRIIIEFDNVSANPDINIIDSTSPAKTINYSASYYTDPDSVANVYRVEYEIFNLSPCWLVSNEIY